MTNGFWGAMCVSAGDGGSAQGPGLSPAGPWQGPEQGRDSPGHITAPTGALD